MMFFFFFFFMYFVCFFFFFFNDTATTEIYTLSLHDALPICSEAIPIFDDNASTNWIAGFRIEKDNEGAFIYIAGRPYRYNNSASYQNYNYIINNWMNYIPVNVDDETSSGQITSYRLFQNYPNPFNPGTTIQYQLPVAGFVSLKVYDIMGQEVTELVNERQSPGVYSVNFDA